MPWENRDYYREPKYGGIGGGGGWRGHVGGFGGGRMIMALIAVNVLVAITDAILVGSRRADAIAPTWWGNFNVAQGIFGFQLWRPFTYQFIHGGLLHLVFNMIGLYVFGQWMERLWGPRKLLAYYLICGLGGALLFGLSAAVPGFVGTDARTPLVGASACVMGMVVGCVMRFPREQLMLWPFPFTLTMQLLGGLYIFFDVLSVVAGSEGSSGALAHIGGVLTGALLIARPGLLDWAERADIDSFRERMRKRSAEKQRQAQIDTELEVDRILDKVRTSGLQSLSNREKKTLQRATDSKRRAG